eukprot:TRINITY_DN2014_c0_g5_i1.p1 TRINITY_DN2014_c0_g5~~TRINITY_DN2014_c0_g5_i1.p1  ORF type:complete len:519 (-),score=90.14 TRINITY_DN2014_c0_g5_i1:51-1607(-)
MALVRSARVFIRPLALMVCAVLVAAALGARTPPLGRAPLYSTTDGSAREAEGAVSAEGVEGSTAFALEPLLHVLRSVHAALHAKSEVQAGDWAGGREVTNGERQREPPYIPQVAPQFTSPIKSEVEAEGRPVYSNVGSFAYDRTGQHMRFRVSLKQYLIEESLLIDTVFSWTSSIESVNGQCRPRSSPFVDMFAWLPFASFHGSVERQGVECDLWELSIRGVSLSLALFNRSLPVQWDVYPSADSHWSFTFAVKEMNAHPEFDVSAFAAPHSCSKPMLVCDTGPIVELPLYRFHPEGEQSPASHNVADLLGEAYYLCKMSSGIATTSNTLITLYHFQLNSTWGQYAKCNAECDAQSLAHVGRQAIEGMRWLGGQCDPAADIGMWFSIPRECECSARESPFTAAQEDVSSHLFTVAPEEVSSGVSTALPEDVSRDPFTPEVNSAGERRDSGTGQCMWKVLSRQRTITWQCVQERGYAAACNQDASAPFNAASQILWSSFMGDDPCAAVGDQNSSGDWHY